MLESIDKKLDDQYKRINSLEKFKQEQILKKLIFKLIQMVLKRIFPKVKQELQTKTKLSMLETSEFVKRNELTATCLDIHNALNPNNKATLESLNKLIQEQNKLRQVEQATLDQRQGTGSLTNNNKNTTGSKSKTNNNRSYTRKIMQDQM